MLCVEKACCFADDGQGGGTGGGGGHMANGNIDNHGDDNDSPEGMNTPTNNILQPPKHHNDNKDKGHYDDDPFPAYIFSRPTAPPTVRNDALLLTDMPTYGRIVVRARDGGYGAAVESAPSALSVPVGETEILTAITWR